MKTRIFVALTALIFVACKKINDNPPYQSQGVIIGDFIGLCPLNLRCGGLEITIKNDTTKNRPAFYYIDTALTQLGISANTKFPINVSLNWKHDPTAAYYIIVSGLKVD
jgi:hypothetical protein